MSRLECDHLARTLHSHSVEVYECCQVSEQQHEGDERQVPEHSRPWNDTEHEEEGGDRCRGSSRHGDAGRPSAARCRRQRAHGRRWGRALPRLGGSLPAAPADDEGSWGRRESLSPAPSGRASHAAGGAYRSSHRRSVAAEKPSAVPGNELLRVRWTAPPRRDNWQWNDVTELTTLRSENFRSTIGVRAITHTTARTIRTHTATLPRTILRLVRPYKRIP